MIQVRPSAERHRGGDPTTGIKTLHAFSFGGHYDPENVTFGLLTACNEERLAPGAGFAPHLHRDVEIVTWVIEGELTHEDTSGVTRKLAAGDLQRLSSAAGVRHVERNGGAEPLRFLQMWLHPATFGGEPEYAALQDAAPKGPGLHRLPHPLRQPAATLHVGRPQAPDSCVLPAAPYVYVHIVRGTVRLNGTPLTEGDAARITAEPTGVTAQTDGPAEYLVWEMHAVPTYG